jgi:hypothetical protein
MDLYNVYRKTFCNSTQIRTKVEDAIGIAQVLKDQRL